MAGRFLIEFRGDVEYAECLSDAIQKAKAWRVAYLKGGYKLYQVVADEEIRIYQLVALCGEVR